MDLIGKKILENGEAMEKSIHELKVEIVHLCVREREREKKNNSFEITYKKCKSPIQNNF